MHVSKTERLKVNLAAKAACLGISRDVDNWYPHLLLDTVIDRSGVGSIFSSIVNQTKVVFKITVLQFVFKDIEIYFEVGLKLSRSL